MIFSKSFDTAHSSLLTALIALMNSRFMKAIPVILILFFLSLSFDANAISITN